MDVKSSASLNEKINNPILLGFINSYFLLRVKYDMSVDFWHLNYINNAPNANKVKEHVLRQRGVMYNIIYYIAKSVIVPGTTWYTE